MKFNYFYLINNYSISSSQPPTTQSSKNRVYQGRMRNPTQPERTPHSFLFLFLKKISNNWIVIFIISSLPFLFFGENIYFLIEWQQWFTFPKKKLNGSSSLKKIKLNGSRSLKFFFEWFTFFV